MDEICSTDDTDTDVEFQTLIDEIDKLGDEESHRTIIFNDHFHVFDDVVYLVSYATGKLIEEAFAITMEAHNHGQAVCFQGSLDDCRRVGFILMSAGLIVEVE